MAGEKSIIGIKSVVFGAVQADGSFPSSTTPVEQIVPGSVSMTFEETSKTDIFVEGQDDPYVSVPDTKRLKSVAFGIRNIMPDTLKEWFGGSVSDEGTVGYNNVWEAPLSESPINKAVKLISEDFGDYHFEITIYNALVRAKLDGKFVKDDTAIINIVADVQANYNGSGTAIPAIKIKRIPKT